MENENFKIINDNSLNMLDCLQENSIDAIICDPPYELGFMGKKWDSTGIAYNVELWRKAYKVLKPGGYLLAFGGSRTFHRIACAIEDAGFEIRDTIMWLYGSGFPKSHNIGLAVDELNGVESKQAQNEWSGWGTALKPAFEPIIMARKPISEKNIAENCLKWRVGGLNIDGCRVGNEEIKGGTMPKMNSKSDGVNLYNFGQKNAQRVERESNFGRFPANVITDGSEEVASGMPDTNGSTGKPFNKNDYKDENNIFNRGNYIPYNDEGSAMRYFYQAKASKKDRDGGLDLLDGVKVNDGIKKEIDNAFQRGETLRKNIHPTVKPVELMQYLVRLVSPKGATILDIFNGSGSTGKAVAFENRERESNYKYIGIELSKEYCEISKLRIEYALNKYEYDMIQDIKKEERETGQLSLFDFGE